MPIVHIEGLRSEGQRGFVWLLIGTICLVVSLPSWLALIAFVVLGAAGGALKSVRLSRGKLDQSKWWTVGYCLVVIGLVLVASGGRHISPINAFGLGGIALGIRNIIPWLFEGRINSALNNRLGFTNDDNEGKADSQQPVPTGPDEALRLLMEEFPDPIWEHLTRVSETALMVPASQVQVRSRLGGSAELPTDFTLPMHGEVPLTYLAQVDLAELSLAFPASPLPTHGRLVFFYNEQDQPWGGEECDRGSGAIFHLATPAAPARGEGGPPAIPVCFEVGNVREYTNEVERRQYEIRRTLTKEKQRRFDLLTDSAMPHTEGSRLLGFPEKVQNDMDLELREASRSYGLPDATEWEMILQLESHDELGWCWGDAGVLYFWIPSEDLQAARFDRCWVVLQCT